MKPCTFLDVDNCGNVDMKPVSTRVNWSGASRGLRTKRRTASIPCRPAPPRQTEALSSRTSRSRPLETSQPSGARAKKDRKSTRLNSSHITISYAVFCLKKKKNHNHNHSVL